MSKTVRLVNLTGVAYPIVLDHPAFRDRRWGFEISSSPRIVQSRDGTRSKGSIRRALVGSITLPPRGEVPGLHPAIAKVPQVKALLARSAVRIDPETDVPEPIKPPKPDPKPDTESTGSDPESTELEQSGGSVALSSGRRRRGSSQGD